jgi:hypothetical protein
MALTAFVERGAGTIRESQSNTGWDEMIGLKEMFEVLVM